MREKLNQYRATWHCQNFIFSNRKRRTRKT